MFVVSAGDDASSAVLQHINCSYPQNISYWNGQNFETYIPELHGDVRNHTDFDGQYLQFDHNPGPIASSGDALYVHFYSDFKAGSGTRRFQSRYHLFVPGLISLYISY